MSRLKIDTDTEISWCFWCRGWHDLHRHHYLKRFSRWGDKQLERIAYSVAIFALICFGLALLIAVAALLD